MMQYMVIQSYSTTVPQYHSTQYHSTTVPVPTVQEYQPKGLGELGRVPSERLLKEPGPPAASLLRWQGILREPPYNGGRPAKLAAAPEALESQA